MNKYDVIIVGSGIAALQTALKACEQKKVLLLTKNKLRDSNSYLAQGGIASAISQEDISHHLQDTIVAGRNYNEKQAVGKLVKAAPYVMQQVMDSGMEFDRDIDGSLKLGLEGAHSERRILHRHGDATGKYLIEHYLGLLKKTAVIIKEEMAVTDLLHDSEGSCIGVAVCDKLGKMMHYFAAHTVLATGGCGSLFSFTSNAATVSGDGLALALRAGARLRDLEFIQFHPTLLYIKGKTKGLVSEAVRGEGALLMTESGKEIMKGVHPLGNLAPRHIVAQTIFSYLEKGETVFLDISMIADFTKRFPTVASLCEENGIDPLTGKIPVAPGNHFLMGGVETDTVGRTSVKGLYAVGEVACTGVHGANRLASNSLLEGLVFGRELGKHLAKEPIAATRFEKRVKEGLSLNLKLPELAEIQEMLMANAGIFRTEGNLRLLQNWLESFDIERLLNLDMQSVTRDDARKVFALLVAWLIAESALCRTESRGGHYRSDYPVENDRQWLHTSIIFDRETVIKRLKGREPNEYIKIKANS